MKKPFEGEEKQWIEWCILLISAHHHGCLFMAWPFQFDNLRTFQWLDQNFFFDYMWLAIHINGEKEKIDNKSIDKTILKSLEINRA